MRHRTWRPRFLARFVPVWTNGHCRTDLVDQFSIWSKENSMICNPSKCKRMDIRELLEKADKKIFKVRSVDPDCPLSNIIPKKKETKYQLRNKSAHHPDIKTDRVKNVFVRRPLFLNIIFHLSIICIEYTYFLCIFRLLTAD